MLIAFIVTLGALAASTTCAPRSSPWEASRVKSARCKRRCSRKARTAANARRQAKRAKFTLIANTYWTFDLAKSDADQLDDFSHFFDTVVRIANQQLTTPAVGLKPYTHSSSEPKIRARSSS